MVIILMGVAGAGKTTIGTALATALGWSFYEGDDFHPPSNIDKMTRGIALTDADRLPWLHALRSVIDTCVADNRDTVMTCSALKRTYRDILSTGHDAVRFVYLQGTYDLIQQRLQARQEHFMPAELLRSQFTTLEEPDDALVIPITHDTDTIVTMVQHTFAL